MAWGLGPWRFRTDGLRRIALRPFREGKFALAREPLCTEFADRQTVLASSSNLTRDAGRPPLLGGWIAKGGDRPNPSGSRREPV
jgi:hypothetical protein